MASSPSSGAHRVASNANHGQAPAPKPKPAPKKKRAKPDQGPRCTKDYEWMRPRVQVVRSHPSQDFSDANEIIELELINTKPMAIWAAYKTRMWDFGFTIWQSERHGILKRWVRRSEVSVLRAAMRDTAPKSG